MRIVAVLSILQGGINLTFDTEQRLTAGSFYPSVLHDGNLERFFFFMAMLMTINTLVYWSISHRYWELHRSEIRGKSTFTKSLCQSECADS